MKNKTMPTSHISLQDRMSRDTQLPMGQEPHKKPAKVRNVELIKQMKSN